MRREVVALETEAADPYLVGGGEIDDRERIDYGSAVAATKRGIREKRRGSGEGLQGGVYGGDRDGAVSGVGFRSREDVPRHADGVLRL